MVNFMLGSSAPGFDEGKAFSQKISEAKTCNIIILQIRLKCMAAQENQLRFLSFQLNRSISVTSYFLDAKFRDMPISAISAPRSSN